MPRTFLFFEIKDFQQTKLKMLNWADQFNICCLLDNHQYNLSPHSLECILAVGEVESISANAGTAFEEFDQFSAKHNDWMFGHLSYDLKNEIEQLTSLLPDRIIFPDLHFFIPEVVIQLNETTLSIGAFGNHHDIFRQIISIDAFSSSGRDVIDIQSRITRQQYVDVIDKLKQHILRGDCYEINYCQEFFAENVELNPLRIYNALTRISPNPFSAYYRLHEKYLMCASPERYLKRTGNKILSQPMKGTVQREADQLYDKKSEATLLNSTKERSENVMVVDLVRNDLSKICMEGSVKVEELFGVYKFPQVFQMVSTVSGILHDDLSVAEMFRATFPMGSMTGAPKKRVMELIEEFETMRRGIFSGAVGYITPEKDFDFNVVIRSLLYNQSEKYLSFPAGSGITYYSDPEKEYEECLLKAAAIKKVLTG